MLNNTPTINVFGPHATPGYWNKVFTVKQYSNAKACQNGCVPVKLNTTGRPTVTK